MTSSFAIIKKLLKVSLPQIIDNTLKGGRLDLISNPIQRIHHDNPQSPIDFNHEIPDTLLRFLIELSSGDENKQQFHPNSINVTEEGKFIDFELTEIEITLEGQGRINCVQG